LNETLNLCVDMSLRILEIFEPFIKNSNAIKTRVTTANLTLVSLKKYLFDKYSKKVLH